MGTMGDDGGGGGGGGGDGDGGDAAMAMRRWRCGDGDGDGDGDDARPSRVLLIELTDGGAGYGSTPPAVAIVAPRLPKSSGGLPATARAVLDGRGGIAR